MAGINIVDKLIIKDNSDNEVSVDSLANALNTIEVEHKKIHDGKGFTYSKDYIVEAEGTLDFLLVNPTGNYPHLRYYAIESTGSPGSICIYKDCTIASNGTLQTIYNNNLNSVITSNLQVYFNPTITDIGTQLDCDIIFGAKFQGGSVTPYASEWILVPNNNYILRYENKSGIPVDVNFHMFHYE